MSYDLETGKLVNAWTKKVEDIKEYVVMFQTPYGLCSTWAAAKERLESCDMPPTLIRPVAVAVGESGIYEIIS